MWNRRYRKSIPTVGGSSTRSAGELYSQRTVAFSRLRARTTFQGCASSGATALSRFRSRSTDSIACLRGDDCYLRLPFFPDVGFAHPGQSSHKQGCGGGRRIDGSDEHETDLPGCTRWSGGAWRPPPGSTIPVERAHPNPVPCGGRLGRIDVSPADLPCQKRRWTAEAGPYCDDAASAWPASTGTLSMV